MVVSSTMNVIQRHKDAPSVPIYMPLMKNNHTKTPNFDNPLPRSIVNRSSSRTGHNTRANIDRLGAVPL